VVSRERQRQFDAREAITLETANGEHVAIQRVADADGQERDSTATRASGPQEEGIAQRFTQRFEAALQKLHEGLARPRNQDARQGLERIGRLKAKSHGLASTMPLRSSRMPRASGQAIRWERQRSPGLAHPPGGLLPAHQ